MSYFVSRQISYPDGEPYVEIETCGLDYASPGMLTSRYPGESKEYEDPEEAAEAAIAIRTLWQGDEKEAINISIGTTGGGLAVHCPEEMADDEVRRWAETESKSIERCDRCGDPLPKKFYRRPDDWTGEKFCSEYCVERAVEFDREVEDDNPEEE